MDFKFLLDPGTKGIHHRVQRFGSMCGQLLLRSARSEARLASFVANRERDAQQEHWFRLGRQLVLVDGGRTLISWTGTMFEYLMPLLVMRNYKGTLLDETYRTVGRRQIEYGRERGVPWGVSEAAYNVVIFT